MAAERNSSTPPAPSLPPLHPFTLQTYLTDSQLAKLHRLVAERNRVAAEWSARGPVEYLQLTPEDVAAHLLADALDRLP